jgi:hypothetical protein
MTAAIVASQSLDGAGDVVELVRQQPAAVDLPARIGRGGGAMPRGQADGAI